ncbi:MAG: GntR family transcriptional regulator [Caulobacter sp.]|jgi:DNA-binding GntR family transcriptional regulator|uniref:GntR family transcriptional regulator n=1 Tax=Caulobacter sp. CCH9-E1 TaxID=1768768 RepID=UPI00082D8B07|nr:GntR family transcriptional regulator [Caulobacter sp. CCH9-E1]MCK5909831.1 GntR family transcriptional regulator [Caulobacter sp.]
MIRSAPNAAAAVAEHLRDQIVQGLLRPGVLLRQEAVAAELGVSRIPVFHALAKLESEGLIEISPNRAAFVSTPSARRCLEIFDLRRLLEGDMLARAIGQHTQRSLRAVRAVMLELEDDEGPRAWIAADRRYYAALCGPAERDLTLMTVQNLRNAVDRIYLASEAPVLDRETWIDRYQALFDAVAAQDRQRSVDLLGENIGAMQAMVASLLPDQPANGTTGS